MTTEPTLFDADDEEFLNTVRQGLAHVERWLAIWRAEAAENPLRAPHPKLAEYEAAEAEYRKILETQGVTP